MLKIEIIKDGTGYVAMTNIQGFHTQSENLTELFDNIKEVFELCMEDDIIKQQIGEKVNDNT